MVNLAPHDPFTHAQQRKLANLDCERHGEESLSLRAFNEAADFLEREPQDLSRKEAAKKEILLCLPTKTEPWWLVNRVQFKRLPDRLRGVTLHLLHQSSLYSKKGAS